MIEVKGLTLTYPSGKGVFDLNFSVGEGKVMGYLGPNGAGKTTTIRALMGFMKQNSGSCKIDGMDCYAKAAMSSNMFEEVERTCDGVLIIKDGRIIAKSGIEALKSTKRKGYIVQTPDGGALQELGYTVEVLADDRYVVYVLGEEIDSFVKQLAKIRVTGLDIKAQNLEDIFLNLYGKGEL